VLVQIIDGTSQAVLVLRIRQVDRVRQRCQLPVLAHQWRDVLGVQLVLA
jgi:hypothetical protein